MMDEPDPDADRPITHRLDARHYGEPDDATPSELHGVAPPCDRCGDREATVRLDVERDLCDDCATVVEAREQFLEWLSPVARGDYVATVVEGDRHAERAAERDVDQSVVSRNVSRARDRLQEIAEQEGEL